MKLFASLGAFAVLFAFWLLLSGYFTAFLMASGVGSAIAVVWFARRMDMAERDERSIGTVLRALGYWPWLLQEIAKSGWSVSKAILDPKLPISPTLVRFAPTQRSVLGLVIHANSITLTPGTITIEGDANEFLVHALTKAGAAGCVDS
ncbi:MAG: Na+/H+ antiporter subunit E, partial [Betaproteobacteria bacterium]|nr:Na+/H+ antiporter subunit E [Betaproteobacteria bacterium]